MVVEDLGLMGWGSGWRVKDLRLRIQRLGFTLKLSVSVLGFGVQDLGCSVSGRGMSVLALHPRGARLTTHLRRGFRGWAVGFVVEGSGFRV